MKPLTKEELLDLELEKKSLEKTIEELSKVWDRSKGGNGIVGTPAMGVVLIEPNHDKLIKSLRARAKALQEIIEDATTH